jgi:hypothetical protein
MRRQHLFVPMNGYAVFKVRIAIMNFDVMEIEDRDMSETNKFPLTGFAPHP